MKQLIPLTLLALLAGCASYPDKVAVTENTVLVDYQDENQAKVNNVGQTARWSGVIADIKNGKRSTRLDVLYYPAKTNGRPMVKDEPLGRFRVKVDRFLDPEVYKKGKAITALGQLSEKESDKIGDYEYEYPTIGQAKLFLWPAQKQVTQVRVDHFDTWYGFYPRYYWHGGVRHVYLKGQGKQQIPTASSKNNNNNK